MSTNKQSSSDPFHTGSSTGNFPGFFDFWYCRTNSVRSESFSDSAAGKPLLQILHVCEVEICNFANVQTTLGAKSNKRCDRLNIFKTITVQKNPIVLTGCKRFSDITFLSSQISTFGMVIVCTGTDHRRRSVEIFVELSFQCRSASKCIHVLKVVFKLVHAL